MAEVFVGQPDFFGAEQESHSLRLQLLANRCAGVLVEPAHRLLQYAIAHGCRSHHQRAIGDGLGHGLVFLRAVEQVRGADRGASLAKPSREGIHQAQPVSAEIAHGTSRGANVQRIARAHQHHHETV